MSITQIEFSCVADRFVELLKGYLGNEKMRAIAEANRREVRSSVCHTHDFCDANEFMLQAFEFVFARPHDLQSDEDIKARGEAWTIASALIDRRYPSAATNQSC